MRSLVLGGVIGDPKEFFTGKLHPEYPHRFQSEVRHPALIAVRA